ncbi:MAG: hypothetical protein Q7R92_03770 [bacterium]|nr:hypothetical protein [bacterium]
MEIINNARFKKVFALTLILSSFFLYSAFCYADNLGNAFKEPLNNVAGEKGAGYKTDASLASPDSMISLVIRTVIELVGVIFLVLAIYAGYTWMMARGNDEMVEKAKNTLINAIIGLVIVLAAYAISWYALNALGSQVLK